MYLPQLISDKQLHSFQYVSFASIFQNPFPLTLRNNLADFSIWIHSGCSKKDQRQPQLEFSWDLFAFNELSVFFLLIVKNGEVFIFDNF